MISLNIFIFHAGTVLALSDKNQSTESTDGDGCILECKSSNRDVLVEL